MVPAASLLEGKWRLAIRTMQSFLFSIRGLCAKYISLLHLGIGKRRVLYISTAKLEKAVNQ